MFRKVFHRAIRIGTIACGSSELKRRIIILNKISLFFVIVCALFVPLFYFSGFAKPAIMAIFVTISYALPFLFNYKHLYSLARIWSYATVTIAATAYAIVLGSGFQIQLALYPAAALPFIYFGREKRRVVYSLFLLAIVGFVVQHYMSKDVPISYLDDYELFVFSIFMSINSFLMLGISLYAINEDARYAENNLKLANVDKRKLVSLLCHDIANPLSLCFFGASQMKKLLGEDKQANFAYNKLNSGLERISEIIESVRYLEATELGKVRLKKNHVDILKVIDEAYEGLRERFEQKHIELVVNSDLKAKYGVLGDEMVIKNNIITNLLTNSLKFSPENSKIFIDIAPSEQSVILELGDQGIGMSDELLGKVFDATETTSRVGLGGEKGTGFGLPLVKALVEKFGGEIDVRSIEKTDDSTESGTTFTLTFQQSIDPIKNTPSVKDGEITYEKTA